MTTPSIVPTKYQGNDLDYNKTKGNPDGNVTQVVGTVSVPSGTAATTIVGLVPFNAGASFVIGSTSVYCGNFGAASTTVDLGIIYDDNVTYTNDVDAFASAATAPQSGGFVSIDEFTGLTTVTQGNGWLAITINTAAADATADIAFNVGVVYAA